MKLDDTLKVIINKIIIEVKDKYGITFTLEEVFNCIDSQIEATKIGFTKGIAVHWIRFGKFLYTERNDRGKAITSYVNDLNDESTDLTSEQKEIKRKEYIIIKSEERKKIYKEQKTQSNKHSLDDIKHSESTNPSKLPILQFITRPKKEDNDS